MTTHMECEICGQWFDKQYGGCEACEKQKQSDAFEKKQRKKESSYHNNTGKYKKKDKLKSTWRS